MNNIIIWNIKPLDELSPEELYKIMVARQEVFMVEQKVSYQDADNYDQKALHLWAEDDTGDVLAYCRIFPEGVKYPEASIGRVLTTKNARGKGLGKQLVAFAIECIENRFSAKHIKISAQDYLLKFYTDFGFKDTGKKYLEDTLPHTEMVR